MGINSYDEEIDGQLSFEDYFPVPQRMFAVSKIFARAIKQMTTEEYKAFVYALTNIEWTKPMPSVERQGVPIYSVEMDKKELANILNVDSDPRHLARDLHRVLKDISKHSQVEFKDEDQGLYINGSVINTIILSERNKAIMDFNPRYAKLFSELESDYITMLSGDVFKMNSERSIIFYEHLRLHSDTTKECQKGIGVKALKEMFNLPKDAYMRKKGGFDRANFEKRIIDPICEDMAKCEMIQLVVQPDGKYYRKVKQGNRVLGYEFTWNVSDRPRIANASEMKKLRDDIAKDPQALKVAKDIVKGKAKKKGKAANKNSFTNYEQPERSQEDYSELEKQLLDN